LHSPVGLLSDIYLTSGSKKGKIPYQSLMSVPLKGPERQLSRFFFRQSLEIEKGEMGGGSK